jgi:hypothetical protein
MAEKPPTIKDTLDAIKKTVAEEKPRIAAALGPAREQARHVADEVRKAMGLNPKARGAEVEVLRALCAEQGSSPEGMVRNPLETVRARGVVIESGAFDAMLDALIEKGFVVEEAADYVKVLSAGFAAAR